MTRRRSYWAWGWEDRFPNPGVRAMLAHRLEQTLGLGGLTERAPRPIEAIALTPPRIAAPEGLAEVVTADRRERLVHTYGRAFPDLARGLAGDFTRAPDLVAFPRDEGDIERILAWAGGADVAVIPYGGGTSVVGGVEAALPRPYAGVVSLDLGRLDRVLEVDAVSRLARVQAGTTGPALEEQLGAHGLTLRHYPQSFEHSTVGGWIATRAGGHFATVYTHIDDLVAGTRMITPAGVFETRPLPGSGAGPSPDRLVLGSEGALGVITEAWLRVRPRPVHRASATVRFAEWGAAVDAVRAVAQAYLFPTNCRLLDRREAALNMVGKGDAHLLLLGFESAEHPVGGLLEHALALTRRHGGACPGGPTLRDAGAKGRAREADAWRGAFLEAPYLFSALVALGAVVDTFETAVPWARFPALHAAVVGNVREAMARVSGAKGLLTCRFTHVYPDGPAPYYTFITAARPGEELAQWAAIKEAASEALLAHGATITHHHAVGRTHRPWYGRQAPRLFTTALAAVKGTLDPHGILNPGVLLPG